MPNLRRLNSFMSRTVIKDEKAHKVHCGTCYQLGDYDIIAWEPNNKEDIVIVCKHCGQRYPGKLKLTKINTSEEKMKQNV